MTVSSSIVTLQRPHLIAQIMGLFGTKLLREAAIRRDRVDLRFGRKVESVPYQDLKDIKRSSGMLYSTLELERASSKLRLTVSYADDAAIIESAIIDGQDAWLTEGWRAIVEDNEQEVNGLIRMLDDLDNPTRYYQKSWFDAWRGRAENAVSRLPVSAPNRIGSEIHEFVDKVQRIRKLLQDAEGRRKTANKTFIQNELDRSRSYFDSIEGKPLTQEQRLAIVTDEDSNLVVAAAGSGKTSVIVGKFRWLIDRGYRSANEVLMLVFAKNAESEMSERVMKLLNPNASAIPKVSTFHGLGYSIVGKVEGKLPSLAKHAEDDKLLRLHIRGIIKSLMEQEDFARVMKRWFQEHFAPYKSQFDFKSKGEYFVYLRKHDIRSLKGELVRSYEECEIANFLYLNGIEYEYEKNYEHDTATEGHRQYQPDFYLPESGLYIEHLALNREGGTPPFIPRKKYIDSLKWKQNIHDQYGTTMLKTYSWWNFEGELVVRLEKLLKERGVKFSEVSTDQMFSRLNELHMFDPFTEKVEEFLNHFKEQGLDESGLADRIGRGGDEQRDKAFANVFLPIYREYENGLRESGEIDFNDMIGKAIEYVESGQITSPYRYIMVDEFQDISAGRIRLLKALLGNNCETSEGRHQLFAVGDDWQSIYRFAGSDITAMQDFSKIFGNTERTDLTTTFRCSERITEISRMFILRNKEQIGKETTSYSPRIENSVYVYFPPTKNEPSMLERIIARIAKHGENEGEQLSVLVLGRYRHQRPDNLRRLQKLFRSIDLEYRTVHSSKGCEADYVVVVGMESGNLGFPSEKQSDTTLNMVLSRPEIFPHAEERRLFYVAITRARRSVYLLSEYGSRSEFLNELVTEGYGVKVFGQLPSQEANCPACETGRMVLRQGNKEGGNKFYGCSNYPYCKNIESTCPYCDRGIPVRKNEEYACNSCKNTFLCCPVKGCQGWLSIKDGKYGSFFGCSQYPICTYTRNAPQAPPEPAPE